MNRKIVNKNLKEWLEEKDKIKNHFKTKEYKKYELVTITELKKLSDKEIEEIWLIQMNKAITFFEAYKVWKEEKGKNRDECSNTQKGHRR